MGIVQTIANGNNPLGTKLTFKTEIDGPALVLFSGSAYSNTWPNMTIGLNIDIDGSSAGVAQLYANELNSHKTLVSSFQQINITPGNHLLTIDASTPATYADALDVYSVSLWDQPEPAFVWQVNGPVPQYTTFNSEVSGTALVFLQGSAWSSSGNENLGLMVILDGNPVLTVASYVNEANSHHALPAFLAPVEMTPGPHKIGISTTSGDFNSDSNDFYTLVVMF